MRITDLDQWRRVCLAAFDNLATDTTVTMGQVDRVLMAGAREYITLPDIVTGDRLPKLLDLHARVADATGVDQTDVDAILCVAAEDAAALLAPDDAPPAVVNAEWQNDGTAVLTIACPRCTWLGVAQSHLAAIVDAHNAQAHGTAVCTR